jgi:protein-disulfide isomerase
MVGVCLLAAQLANSEPRRPCASLKEQARAEPAEEAVANDRAFASISMRVNIQGEPFRGSAEAPVAIIEYGDYQCSFCARFKQDVYPQIEADYLEASRLKYIYRDLPLASHRYALPAARAAYCAKEQGKYWEMHERIFTLKQSFSEIELTEQAQAIGLRMEDFRACVEDRRSEDEIVRVAATARMMQIENTPTFLIGTVAPGGDSVDVKAIVVGAKGLADFKVVIDPLIVESCRVIAAQ